MNKKSSAAEFLENMKQQEPEAQISMPASRQQKERKVQLTNSREGLKHIGGYLNDEMVEKVAILRARLKLDNSELITLAVNELYTKQKAKKAFND